MIQHGKRSQFIIFIVVLLAATLFSGCAAKSAGPALAMAPMDGMPMEVQSASAPIREAYQFAAANEPILKHIPCYCGCEKMGHKSNYDCYISPDDSASNRKYDLHAVNCAVCINITHDVMQSTQSGQPTAEIRVYIDLTYAKYGSSTPTK